jgi:hypothetical protein
MLIGLMTLAMLAQPEGAWSWTLYVDSGSVVLAEEIADTEHLRNTLECQVGSGMARLTLYRDDAAAGFVTLTSGSASAQGQAEVAQGGADPGVATAIAVDHPVFAAFRASGSMTLRTGALSWTLEAPQAELPKLRRFAELCAG